MAKSRNNSRSALCILILSIVVIFPIAESRSVISRGLVRADATPTCDQVFGTRSGDTCFSIAQGFGLTTAEFDSINPNLNCAALFVGQWLCVQGSA